MAGYADITVPATFVGPLPIGMTFIGSSWDEPELIGRQTNGKRGRTREEAVRAGGRPPCSIER